MEMKERPCMAQEPLAIHFEDLPLAEARTMGRGPRMDPELYHAFKEKIPHCPAFSGGACRRSSEASGGEELPIEEPVGGGYAPAFDLHATLTWMLALQPQRAENLR
jgi:hypothetical protein